MAANDYFYGIGRRKSAVARVRLTGKKGNISVNEKPLENYLGNSKNLHSQLVKPFTVLEIDPDNFNATVKVVGGGISSQVGAIQLGLAKSLVALNEDYRGTLKKADLLGRDPREKERKKPGLRSARKKQQYSKR